VQAIRTVAKGKRYITSSVAERMAIYIEVDSERPRHELLSDRELQVLVLLGGGKSVGDIAGELSLSVKPTAQLIKYAVQYDLVQ
jgi:DNA-binding NarL/FixJ family response regulator